MNPFIQNTHKSAAFLKILLVSSEQIIWVFELMSLSFDQIHY